MWLVKCKQLNRKSVNQKKTKVDLHVSLHYNHLSSLQIELFFTLLIPFLVSSACMVRFNTRVYTFYFCFHLATSTQGRIVQANIPPFVLMKYMTEEAKYNSNTIPNQHPHAEHIRTKP